jgi:predicted DNA-binding protein
MLEVKLTPELETALSREARRARKSKATLVRDAVAQYLQEVADYQAVLDSRKRRGRTHTLDQVKQRLGLVG